MARVEETKQMFKVVAANANLNRKQKTSYYNMLRDLLKLKRSFDWVADDVPSSLRNIDGGDMSQVLKHKEALAKLMKGGNVSAYEPYKGWKNPLAWINGLLIMGGWLEKPEEKPIMRIKPKKLAKAVAEVNGNDVIIDLVELAKHLGIEKIGRVTFKL